MSGFVRLDRLDPYELFGAQVRRSRLAIRTAYDEAFAAWDRRKELLQEHQWSSAYGGQMATKFEADLDRMWDEAIAENIQADIQAGIVVLVTNDALQRFARGVLVSASRAEGYGADYGVPYKGTVKLTVLLRAAANSVRHASEWDDLPWDKYRPWPSATLGPFPTGVYPTLEDCAKF
jgi:hypothetical protein